VVINIIYSLSLALSLSLGPCFFLSCPVTVEEFRSWFIDLWNLSIIPYLQEGAKDGIKVRQVLLSW
jgi:neuron navigator 1